MLGIYVSNILSQLIWNCHHKKSNLWRQRAQEFLISCICRCILQQVWRLDKQKGLAWLLGKSMSAIRSYARKWRWPWDALGWYELHLDVFVGEECFYHYDLMPLKRFKKDIERGCPEMEVLRMNFLALSQYLKPWINQHTTWNTWSTSQVRFKEPLSRQWSLWIFTGMFVENSVDIFLKHGSLSIGA